MEVSQF